MIWTTQNDPEPSQTYKEGYWSVEVFTDAAVLSPSGFDKFSSRFCNSHKSHKSSFLMGSFSVSPAVFVWLALPLLFHHAVAPGLVLPSRSSK